LERAFCYHARVNTFFKNSRVWFLVPCAILVVGTGVFLFRGKSATVVEKSADDVAKSESASENPALSKEASDDLVKKLEEGNTTPGEAESGNDANVDATPSDQTPADTRAAESSNRKKETPENANTSDEKLSIVNKLVSWGFTKASDRKIDTVVIHSPYNATGGDPFSVSKIIGIYKRYGVSPHYLVARDGTVYRLVEEQNVAYHAGDSKMPDGRTNVNTFSIGIEIIGKDDGTPSDEQYAALEKLLSDIKSRNDIKHIVGHSDIAPGRKTDPWGFDWKKIGGKKL